MPRVCVAALLIVAAALLQPAALGSQTRVGLSVGVAAPSGDFGDVANTGVNVEGNVEIRPGEMPFALRADLFLSRFGIDEDATEESGSIRAFGAGLSALFQLAGAGITPYALVGPTVTNLDVSIDGTDDEAEVGTNFGVQAGAGLKFLVSGYLTRFEVRVGQVFSEDDSQGIPDARWVTVNLGLLFGGRGD
jgi:opacity protein-like surface antigen